MTIKKPLSIAFSDDCCSDGYELSLTFSACVDGQDITCLISLDTLQECFGCEWANAEEEFFLHRARIESVAHSLIENGRVDAEGELRLRAADFCAATAG